jgi:tRNA synthetases class I (C) catalytic domain/DALR domain
MPVGNSNKGIMLWRPREALQCGATTRGSGSATATTTGATSGSGSGTRATERMVLRLYDTGAKQEREFVPRPAGSASMYVCGAPVQGPEHLGHLRSAVVYDVLRRWLTCSGLDVLFVRNVTDIEDKILAAAADAGRGSAEGFVAALNADPATSAAVATIHRVVRNGNAAQDRGDAGAASAAGAAVRAMADVFGLDPLTEAWEGSVVCTSAAAESALSALVDQLLRERDDARALRDFVAAERCAVGCWPLACRSGTPRTARPEAWLAMGHPSQRGDPPVEWVVTNDGCNRLAGEYCLSPRGPRAVLSDVSGRARTANSTAESDLCAMPGPPCAEKWARSTGVRVIGNLTTENLFRHRTSRESLMSAW